MLSYNIFVDFILDFTSIIFRIKMWEGMKVYAGKGKKYRGTVVDLKERFSPMNLSINFFFTEITNSNIKSKSKIISSTDNIYTIYN